MRNNFRPFTTYDYYVYSGAFKLPNGDKPLICNDYEDIDVIISGDDDGNTSISIIGEDHEYVLNLSGYNMCHQVIADAIIDELNYEKSNLASNFKLTIEGIANDFGMIKL